jgi:hypothetical protein
MARRRATNRSAADLKRAIRQTITAARAAARRAGGGGQVNVARRLNKTVVINTGEAGATESSSSVQYAPIVQVRTTGRKEDSFEQGR